jgi:hypothetical protein
VRLIEVEIPQAIGMLNKILRNLEEYHAVRARDPRTAYDDVAIAKAIWDEGDGTEGEAENVAADGAVASATGDGPEDASSANANATQEGN